MKGQVTRAEENIGFTQIHNHIFRNKNVSYRAKGLLCQLLSLPPKFTVMKTKLHFLAKEGRDATITAFNELVDAGYILPVTVLGRDGEPPGWSYIVYSTPQKNPENSEISPIPENPLRKVSNGKSVTESQEPLLNTTRTNTLIKNTIKEEPPIIPQGGSSDLISGMDELKKTRKSKRQNFNPPSLEEVKEYCAERGNDVNPNKWMDFYESKGWMVGKNKMKDWKAAIRTWEKDDPKKKANEKHPDVIEERFVERNGGRAYSPSHMSQVLLIKGIGWLPIDKVPVGSIVLSGDPDLRNKPFPGVKKR